MLHVRGESVTVSGQHFHCSADGELFGPERQPGLAPRAGRVLHAPAVILR